MVDNTKTEFSYFASQINNLRDNAVEASVSILGFKNPTLRQHVVNELKQDTSVIKAEAATPEGLMGNPVFEVLFPWQGQSKDIEQFENTLLHPKTVSAVASDIKTPYKHQARAWEILNDKSKVNSLVVTSGTGSGKTECFMVPILDDLVRLQEEEGGALNGVRALFLYPLNALINSQKDRLDKWTKPFGKQISFCLYNGNTPEAAKQEKPNQIVARQKLRETPPPILVTNATMLEYMLIRQKDASIISQSKGKLRWIVLDEAHSYIGSTAAELSLLLRRVMLAFAVEAKDVHFVATSATIGDDDDAKVKLTNYLAALAGVDVTQIHIINAQRSVPELKASDLRQVDQGVSLLDIEQTDSQNPVSLERYHLLENHLFARKLRACFVSISQSGGTSTHHNDLSSLKLKLEQPLRDLIQQGEITSNDSRSIEAYLLRWLDVCSYTKPHQDKIAFLPLRGHLFQRTLSGLYTCINPECDGKHHTPLAGIDDKGKPIWEFGYLFTSKRQYCTYCKYPVYELVLCNECQTPHLLTQKTTSQIDGKRVHKLIQYNHENADDFSLNNEIDYDVNEQDEAIQDADESLELTINDNKPTVLMPFWSSPLKLNNKLKKYEELVEEAYLEGNGRLVRRPSTDAISIIIKETNDNDTQALQHCYFCDTDRDRGNVIRSLYLGAPFYMSVAIPTLLDHCPKDDEMSDSLPYQGRQLITFSDSRQGTAKITMKLRQDSERRSLRHLVYSILTTQYSKSEINTDDIKLELEELREERAQNAEIYSIKALKRLDAEIKENEDLLNFEERPVVSWKEMVKKISVTNEFASLKNSIGRVARVNNITNDEDIAELLLLNEFARRPKNANTLETIGLVSLVYPSLESIKCPDSWVDIGLNQQDWTDFLKLMLDFYVREGKFVNLTFPQLNSLSDKFLGRKKLLPPNMTANLSEKDAKYIKNWVKVNSHYHNNSNRMIRLLCMVTQLELNKNKTIDEDIINELMRKAWQGLTNKNILERDPSNNTLNTYHLNFEKLSLTLPEQVWVCPVTHRFLDTTFKGLTPYIPPKQDLIVVKENIAEYQCKKVSIPVFKPEANAITPKVQANEWISNSQVIQSLRQQNLWTDISSSVVAGMNTIVTEEHSAQLNQKALQKYEDSFKKRQINILNCSTTMEMGVDIGGITGVAMNNVPPHPANYLQRTGRAGRRSETRAIAFTLCKNNPHEQMVFANSSWAFDTKISPPYITLNSEQIVQRHINAYLLSLFLNEQGDTDTSVVTLKSGWFFFGWLESKSDYIKQEVETLVTQIGPDLSDQEDSTGEWFKTNTPFIKMQHWLESLCITDAKSSEKLSLEKSIQSITESSDLYYCSINTILANCLQSLAKLEKYFIEKAIARIKEYQTIKADKKGATNPYLVKLIMDIRGIANGYLLSDLARHGFLPRYGFPSGLVEFDPYHSTSFNKGSKDSSADDREDNQSLRNGKPVRDIAIAIREYAPGNEVAVDGLVYKSAGIELSQYLTGANKKDAQIIRTFWRCKYCGSMNDTYDTKEVHCTGCAKKIDEKAQMRFVEPMGFRVDYTTTPHSKIDSQTFVPIEQPKIQANGLIKPLFSPALGDYRVDEEGIIFYHSSGVYGYGYFICLHCGRAESVKFPDSTPSYNNQQKSFQDHHIPLKPVAEFDFKEEKDINKARGICNKNGYQTQYLHIGAIDKTNVFEIYLKDPSTGDYFSDTKEIKLLATLAVVLRDALARCHGINPDELGAGTKPIKIDGVSITAIYLYDKASGGAGFASAAPQFIHKMFEEAKSILACPAACDSVCHSCLLTYDTRFVVDSLDRNLAIDYLKNIEKYLYLSEEEKLFEEAHFCNIDLEKRVINCLSTAYNQIHLYLQGDPKEWSLSTALGNKIKTWDYNGKYINIVLSSDSIKQLDKLNKIHLAHFSRFDNVKIYTWAPQDSFYLNNHYLLQLSHTDTDRVLTLGTTDLEAYIPNDQYWEVTGDNIVVESDSLPLLGVEEYDNDLLNQFSNNNAMLLTIDEELDGSIASFGDRFWQQVCLSEDIREKLDDKLEITSITYSDRYLCTPLSTMLLGQVLYKLKSIYDKEYSHPVIKVTTTNPSQNSKRNKGTILDKWLDKNLQQEVQNNFFRSLGLEATCSLLNQAELEHHRSLSIFWKDGSKTKINLDHGFGFMFYEKHIDKSKIYSEFDVGKDIGHQADSMLRIEATRDFDVKSNYKQTTLITVYNDSPCE